MSTQPLIDTETAKESTAFTLKSPIGPQILSSYDADLLHLVTQIEDRNRFVQGTPRFLLACLSSKYTNHTEKAVSGRLKFWKNRGYLETEHAEGLSYPAWSRTVKLNELMTRLLEAEKLGKGNHQFTLSIDKPVLSVLEETVTFNGRYKDPHKPIDFLKDTDVDEIEIE